MSKILIAIPTVDGWIHSKLIKALLPQMGNRPLALLAGAVPCERARNQLVDTFLKSDATHLFFVDADTIPPEDSIDRLLALDTDIATGVTPILNHDSITSNIFEKADGEGVPLPLEKVMAHKESFEIGGVGLACVLIKREVIEKLAKPIFTSLWFENGKFVEGDIHFCGKATDAGFKIKCDPSIICGHMKTVEL